MKKKLISLIIGIVLIIAGLLGWNYLQNNQNLDEQNLEEIQLNYKN